MIIVSKPSEPYFDKKGNLIGIIFFPKNEAPIIWNYLKKKIEKQNNEKD